MAHFTRYEWISIKSIKETILSIVDNRCEERHITSDKINLHLKIKLDCIKEFDRIRKDEFGRIIFLTFEMANTEYTYEFEYYVNDKDSSNLLFM